MVGSPQLFKLGTPSVQGPPVRSFGPAPPAFQAPAFRPSEPDTRYQILPGGIPRYSELPYQVSAPRLFARDLNDQVRI